MKTNLPNLFIHEVTLTHSSGSIGIRKIQFKAHLPLKKMLGWLKEGYFQRDLLVRRGCDQQYSQLGQLMNALGRNPFEEHPVAPASEIPVMNNQSQLLHLLGQQRQQVNHGFQQKPLQMVEMQSQLRQLLDHLKRQEGFDELSEHEQQQILIRKYAQRVQEHINPAMLHPSST